MRVQHEAAAEADGDQKTTTMDEELMMDVDEQAMTKEERRGAKEKQRMANEARRVAIDEQRGVLRSFALAGKTAMEAYDHLCKAYGSAAMSKWNVYKRFKEFKGGRTDYRGQRGQHTANRGSPKQRSEEGIAKIRSLIDEDARATITDLCIQSGFGRGAVRKILKEDLGFTKKCARWVPRLLTDEHKAAHVQMAEDWLQRYQADPGFKDKVRK